MENTLNKEQIEEQNERDLRELAHWYGGWDKLRKVIDELEDGDNEATYERYTSDYNAPTAQQQHEKAYKQKYS